MPTEEAQRRWRYGAVFYHEDTRAAVHQNDKDIGIVAGKPSFYGEDRREGEDVMEAGDEARTREEQRMAKRGEKVVDKNGMRWDVTKMDGVRIIKKQLTSIGCVDKIK